MKLLIPALLVLVLLLTPVLERCYDGYQATVQRVTMSAVFHSANQPKE